MNKIAKSWKSGRLNKPVPKIFRWQFFLILLKLMIPLGFCQTLCLHLGFSSKFSCAFQFFTNNQWGIEPTHPIMGLFKAIEPDLLFFYLFNKIGSRLYFLTDYYSSQLNAGLLYPGWQSSCILHLLWVSCYLAFNYGPCSYGLTFFTCCVSDFFRIVSSGSAYRI